MLEAMTPVLSIRQPWAWAICAGLKDIENRTWQTKVRGRILIHAGSSFYESRSGAAAILSYWSKEFSCSPPMADDVWRGGIVGEVEIVDCVTQSASPWFNGPYGFVLQNAKLLPFRPMKGRLGFFNVDEAALYGDRSYD